MSDEQPTPKKPVPRSVPRRSNPQPLMTTLRETSTTAGSLPVGEGMRKPIELDEYRQTSDPLPVEGNTALAPAPAPQPAAQPAPPLAIQPAAAAPTVPDPPVGHFRVHGEPEARSGGGIAELRKLANRHPLIAAGVLLVVASVVAAVYFMTREPSTMSLGALKKRAPELDGQTVTVKGRIGDVFQMGNSHAYLLLQGRDTVVVYTRTTHPIPGDRVTVKGSVSTGYLDGIPRVAIFQAD